MPTYPAQQALIGQVSDENGNSCPVKVAFLNPAASTVDGVLVAAVAGKRIRVLGFTQQCGAAATTVVFNSKGAGAGTAISMTFQNAGNGGAVRDAPPGCFVFQTGVGEALTVTTGTGAATGVSVIYIEV